MSDNMIKNYRLDSDFEIMGSWTIPGYDIEKDGITGKLTFDDNDIEFELYGVFGFLNEVQNDEIFSFHLLNEEYIFGLNQDGYTIILHNAIQLKRDLSNTSLPYSRYKIGKCIISKIDYNTCEFNFEEFTKIISKDGIENIECTSCEFSFKDMNIWMDTSAITKKIYKKSSGIFYDSSNFINGKYIINNKNLQFSNHTSGIVKPYKIEEECFWRLKYYNNKNINLKTLKENTNIFRDLIQVFVDTPVEYTLYKLNLSIKNIFGHNIKADYIFPQFKSKVESKIIIRYTDIMDNFGNILNNWYEKKDKLNLIISNFKYNINVNYFSESNLLNIIRNLEMYHRRFIDNEKSRLKDEKLESYIKKLENYINDNVCEEKYRKRFTNNIKYYSEMNLSKRLSQTFKLLDEKIKNEFLKLPDKSPSDSIQSIVYRLVQTRNYYTHGDNIENYPKSITNTVDQINMASVLNQINKYFIYKELDMLNYEIIDKLIKDRKTYSNL